MRFKGNNKGVNLTVTKTAKFRRRVQIIDFFNEKEGKQEQRTILHYDKMKSI